MKEEQQMTPQKIVAINRRTGSRYIFCKHTLGGSYYLVSTKESCSPWLVNKADLKLIRMSHKKFGKDAFGHRVILTNKK